MDRMTIKEVADYFGTSKNTIKYRVTKLPDNMVTRENGVIYILESGIKELGKGFPKDQPEKPIEPVAQPDTTTTDLVKILTDQLAVKDKQIEELTESNHRLEELLRLEQMKSASLLRIEPESKPRGLLSIFKRKKGSGNSRE